jgi:serine/threonine-protein kinase
MVGLVEGQTLAGKYRIDRMIGAGGMCIVYEAEHVHLRQAIALKLLKPELSRDATAVARFAQEAQAAAKLHSPNIARVYDVDKLVDGQPYITMELLVGHDLGTELQRRYSLPIELAVDYVRQAASGIAEAHALGIVHRDLKPENLFLTELGEMTDRRLLKILDFGIAKDVHESTRKLTAPDAVFGTVDYMSPEQIRSASTVDHRTDIWSLGVILFELLTGRTPYTGDARSVIAQIVSDPVVAPSRYVPTLPPGLVAVVMRALSKDPSARFQSAEELRRALGPYSQGVEPITAVLAKLPPASVPRRNLDNSRGPLDNTGANRTNLSFETGPRGAWAKRAVALPLFAALGATAGLAVWKRDVILHPTPSAAAATSRSFDPEEEVPVGTPTPVATFVMTPAPSPLPTTPTVIGVSTPDPVPTAAATVPATSPSAAASAAQSLQKKAAKRGAPAKPSAAPPPTVAPPPPPPPPPPAPTPAPEHNPAASSSTPTLPKHL